MPVPTRWSYRRSQQIPAPTQDPPITRLFRMRFSLLSRLPARLPRGLAGRRSSRFIIVAPLALSLNCAFLRVRKLGKLFRVTIREEYDMEDESDNVKKQMPA